MSISSNGLNNYELSIGQFGAVKCYLFQGRLSNDLLLNPITDPCHESQWTEDLSPNPCFSLHFSISVWPWTSYLNCNLDSTFLTWTQLNGSKQILNYELEYATNKGPWDSSAGQSAWTKPGDLSLTPGTPWWKKTTWIYKLFSDLHWHYLGYVSSTFIHTKYIKMHLF